MEETKLEKLARLSGKATSKALDALGKRGFDIRGKLSAPISRVPRRNPFTEAKNERVMADPETIYNWRRLDDRITTSGQPTDWVKVRAELKALVEHEQRCAAGKPIIGMTAIEARQAWCEPDHANTTETPGHVLQQWVYPGRGYLYFRDGRLVSIQRTSEHP